MPSFTLAITILVIVLALSFDFINGFHDTATSIATSISTRALTPVAAIVMSAALNLVGAFMSTSVAKTVGADMVNPQAITQLVVLAALLGAIAWNLITWYFGIPSSSSHALIGALIGSAVVFKGSFAIVNWHNFIFKILLVLISSPIIGFFVGYILMTLINWLARGFKPATVTKFFSKAQILSAAAVALNHGGNDAQKSMGVITMALLSAGFIHAFNVPFEVKIACALAMAFGTSVGGWRIIKTMGSGVTRLTPVNGFAAQTAAAGVIFTATMMKAPVSTTHIITGSIMGVGSSKRFSSVRWIVAKNILWAWVITIPISGAFAGLFVLLMKLFHLL